MKPKHQNGFSLIELIIVVAIVGILAALSIPKLLASMQAANEASAQSSLRTIHSCQITYQASTGMGNYGDLAALREDFLTDEILGGGSKSGYDFGVTPTRPGIVPALFYATAVPIYSSGVAQTGTRRFGITENGVMHGDRISLTPYSNEAEVKAAPTVGN